MAPLQVLTPGAGNAPDSRVGNRHSPSLLIACLACRLLCLPGASHGPRAGRGLAAQGKASAAERPPCFLGWQASSSPQDSGPASGARVGGWGWVLQFLAYLPDPREHPLGSGTGERVSQPRACPGSGSFLLQCGPWRAGRQGAKSLLGFSSTPCLQATTPCLLLERVDPQSRRHSHS